MNHMWCASGSKPVDHSVDTSLIRGLYATDASMYQITPRAVFTPAGRDEAVAIIRQCAATGQPLVARGAGTGLAGQAIGDGVVLDLSRYMNRVLEINTDEGWVRVEPGVVSAELNTALRPHGLHFAPDPATQNRATIGGMLANNAAGMRSVRYGMTIDHVLEVELALASGEVVRLGRTDSVNGEADRTGRESEIDGRLRALIERHADEIRQRYPKVLRRSGGYALDALLDDSPWNPAKLICGSEGTLGVVLEAKLKLTPLPHCSAVCMAHFTTLDAALVMAAELVDRKPSAVELIDGVVLERARHHPLTRDLCQRMVVGEPGALLVIEAQADDTREVEQHINELADAAFRAAYAAPVVLEEEAIRTVWQLRSSALGLMTTVRGPKKPVPYIEDAAVPLEQLGAYVKDVLAVCRAHCQPVSLFGHASVGLIHIRPLHDLHRVEEIHRMERIQEEVFSLVCQYGGSWSGEHGDGMVRGRYNKAFFGERLYQAFREVKEIFDPEGRMNPGKVIDTPPLGSYLRLDSDPQPAPVEGVFRYPEGDLIATAEQCTGVGACRKTLEGVMCPSYAATRDEMHSTRGRANALRLALSGQLGSGDVLAGEELHSVMALCLGCKGCKGECPNSVDMTRLKAEVLYRYQQAHGLSLRDWLFSSLPRIASWCSGPQARMVNGLLANKMVRGLFGRWLGIEPARMLPAFSRHRLSHWFRHRRPFASATSGTNGQRRVVLFNDTYTEYFLPQVGRAAVEVLEAAGYQVELATLGDSQRGAISMGRLDRAKRDGGRLVRRLREWLDEDTPLIVCEPSCASALADDLPDLIEDSETGRWVAGRVWMLDHFLEQELQNGRCAPPWGRYKGPGAGMILVHGHCHQKTLDGGRWTHRLLSRLPGAEVSDSTAGCCGMGGTFGYESEHSALSRKIAEQRLLPRLAELPREATVVSNGFSCRHQITHHSDRLSLHVAEVIRKYC